MPEFAETIDCLQAASARLFGSGSAIIRWGRQWVEVVPGDPSIQGSSLHGPYHTDDNWLVPPQVVAMWCDHPAVRGGESLFVDSWKLLTQIESHDPSLYDALFESVRLLPFSGDRFMLRPTFLRRFGNVFISQPAMLTEDDDVGRRFLDWITKAPVLTLRMEPGDVYVSNNHRLLHGRTAFEGSRRLLRCHAWLSESLPIPPPLLDRASRAEERLRERAGNLAPERARVMYPDESVARGYARMNAVLAVIGGAQIEPIAASIGVPSIQLARWVDVAIESAAERLGTFEISADADALEADYMLWESLREGGEG
jgi:hypothetical protein